MILCLKRNWKVQKKLERTASEKTDRRPNSGSSAVHLFLPKYIHSFNFALISELPDLGRLSVFLEAVRSLFFGTFQFRFKQSIKVSVFKISVSLFFVGTERVSIKISKFQKKYQRYQNKYYVMKVFLLV